MKKIILISFLFTALEIVYGQNTFRAFLKDKDTQKPLVFANVILKGTNNGVASDKKGFVILRNIPDGKQTIIFSYVGYRTEEKSFNFPLNSVDTLTIFLEKAFALDEILVYSTRTNNRIKEIPTRIEVLGEEEVNEETAINPGNISKLLGETSGVEIQHVSAVSGNVSFRIQGLPGKYTQLLQDGFPAYSGFSAELSLLQIPPLNLKQVEIIRGSASTLYGADAIAGIINLITKKPSKKPMFSLLLNMTHKGGTDFSSYYAKKKNEFGITVLASINTQKAMDISGNSFTDIPRYRRAVFSPKIFYDVNKNNHLSIAFFGVIENRIGGNITAVENEISDSGLFYEKNDTKRFVGNLKYENYNHSGNIFTFKASYGNFERKLKTNVNVFSGVGNNVFTELSYLVNFRNHRVVGGLDFYWDYFKQFQPIIFSLSYEHKTGGIFLQDNWKISNKMFVEPGVRYDYNFYEGGFLLPRLALMYKFSSEFFMRMSTGLGYKLPTPFSDEAERTRYQKVVMPSHLTVEKSKGINLDFNYKTSLSHDLFLNISQDFFVTDIANPIIINKDSLHTGVVYNENARGTIVSKGFNTNIRLSLDELVLYVDYTFLDARKTYANNEPLELTPRNKLTATLAYEDENEGWKTGIEAFYIGKQYLENEKDTPDYWLLGASIQKRIGHFTIALNVENILDVRQTRYENVVHGASNNPVFSELYAPLEGIVGNIVLKFDMY